MVYLLDVASELSPSPTLKSQIFCFFKSAIYCGVHRNTVEYTEILWSTQKYCGVHRNTVEYTEILWSTQKYCGVHRNWKWIRICYSKRDYTKNLQFCSLYPTHFVTMRSWDYVTHSLLFLQALLETIYQTAILSISEFTYSLCFLGNIGLHPPSSCSLEGV